MSYNAPYGYSITAENKHVVVRFNRNIMDRDAMIRFLDYLEFESIRTRSKLTKEQASALAGEIDQDVWEKIKHKFIRE